MDCGEILKELKSRHNPENVEGMARFGTNKKNTYGVQTPVLRKMAKDAIRELESDEVRKKSTD